MQVDLIDRINKTDMLSQAGYQTCSELTKLITAPDNIGYFDYNESLTSYVEIISFDKMITDEKKREQILFEKLLLPKK